MANRDSSSQPHHSLPARPPATTYSAPPSRPSNAGGRGNSGASTYAGFTPRSVVAQAPPQPSSTYAQTSVSAPYQANPYPNSNAYNNYSHAGYAAGVLTASYPTAIPLNRGFGGAYDAEEEARIAEWNSAYNREDANSKKTGIAGSARAETNQDADSGLIPEGKRKTVVREGGGKTWEDETLLEWNPLHPRLFIGNLAGEVTDDSLLKAFSKYPSLSKARVVRDKKSTKSRSYGFVSFSDTDDYFRAAKEMQGKYIGSHPVLIKRATSEVKSVTKRDDKHQKHGKNNKNNKGSNTKPGGAGTGSLMPNPITFIPRGIQKKGKGNGPRILG